MKLHTLTSLKHEPILEKWVRIFRFTMADKIIEQKIESKKLTLIDYGCGQDILYYKYLKQVFPRLNLKYIGIDPLLEKSLQIKSSNVELIRQKFEGAKLAEKADIITIFAVLEHVDDPAKLLRAAASCLKPDGIIVLTTPSPLAKLPLEFACYVLGIIAKREIDEHKRYPDREYLLGLKDNLGKLDIQQQYFELGLNNLCVVGKDIGKLPAYSILDDLIVLAKVTFRAIKNL